MQLAAIAENGSPQHAAQAPSPRLVAAAHEFEAQMMKEMLEPLTRQTGLTGEDEDGGAETGGIGPLGEFASEALGQALSRAGGFGIADRIVSELSHSPRLAGTGEVTGKAATNRDGEAVFH